MRINANAESVKWIEIVENVVIFNAENSWHSMFFEAGDNRRDKDEYWGVI